MLPALSTCALPLQHQRAVVRDLRVRHGLEGGVGRGKRGRTHETGGNPFCRSRWGAADDDAPATKLLGASTTHRRACPGLTRASTTFLPLPTVSPPAVREQDVDGRVKPGHDGMGDGAVLEGLRAAEPGCGRSRLAVPSPPSSRRRPGSIFQRPVVLGPGLRRGDGLGGGSGEASEDWRARQVVIRSVVGDDAPQTESPGTELLNAATTHRRHARA